MRAASRESVRGKPPVKNINRVYEWLLERKLAGEGLRVLPGSARTEKAGDTPGGVAASLRQVPVRQQGVGEMNRWIDSVEYVISCMQNI